MKHLKVYEEEINSKSYTYALELFGVGTQTELVAALKNLALVMETSQNIESISTGHNNTENTLRTIEIKRW